MSLKQISGTVTIAGAGPGDPELITVKASRALQSADVIIADRLVSEDILREYANRDAIIFRAGKENGNSASTPQAYINALMVHHAAAGKFVVRLKGGDVSFFSNMLDELQTLKQNDIPYQIIPGVTAASGAAAYAGIPLTARGYAAGVRFLTFNNHETLTREYYKELAGSSDTLVFYMASSKLTELVSRFVDAGADEDLNLAIIEQATTPMQRVTICRVGDYSTSHGSTKYISPALVIIGRVSELHEQFKWTNENNAVGKYFNSLPVRQAKLTAV